MPPIQVYILISLAKFWPRRILLSIVCWKRRTIIISNCATVVWAEFLGIRHKIEGSAVVLNHSNAALRQEFQNVSTNFTVTSIRCYGHHRRMWVCNWLSCKLLTLKINWIISFFPFQHHVNAACVVNSPNWNAKNATARCNSALVWRAQASVELVWKKCIRTIDAQIINRMSLKYRKISSLWPNTLQCRAFSWSYLQLSASKHPIMLPLSSADLDSMLRGVFLIRWQIEKVLETNDRKYNCLC